MITDNEGRIIEYQDQENHQCEDLMEYITPDVNRNETDNLSTAGYVKDQYESAKSLARQPADILKYGCKAELSQRRLGSRMSTAALPAPAWPLYLINQGCSNPWFSNTVRVNARRDQQGAVLPRV